MSYVKNYIQNTENEYIDKIVWDSTRSDELNILLQNKVNFFETVTNQIVLNEISIDHGVDMFSNAIYESSFQLFGKTFKSNKKTTNKKKSKVAWFDETCKHAKATFLNSKRNLKLNASEENKIIFLQHRAVFVNIKRQAKMRYLCNEKNKLSELSKKAPRKFWKIINKYKKKNQSLINSPTLDEFTTHFKKISNTQHPNSFRNNINHENVNIVNNVNDDINVNNVNNNNIDNNNVDNENNNNGFNVEFLDKNFGNQSIFFFVHV